MKPTRTPVVVTGLGACTPLGDTLRDSWEALVSRRSGIGPSVPSSLPPGLVPATAMAAAADRTPALRMPKHAKYAGRAVTLALHALAEATAGHDLSTVDAARIAIHAATGQTGLDAEEFFPTLSAAWTEAAPGDFAPVGGRASRLLDPYFSLRTLANGGLALVAAEIGARGPSTNYVQGEMASAFALRAALDDLHDRRADVAIVFACDSLLSPSTWLAFEAENLLSPTSRLRPFDCARDGLVPGEAAAVLVLETASRASQRGATVLAHLDHVHVGQSPARLGTPCADGLATALEAARLDGEWAHAADAADGEASVLVVARGLGTQVHDRVEARTLEGCGLGGAAVTAFKGATGYLGAATGLVELALAVRCLEARQAPPIVGMDAPDDAVHLPLVRAPQPLTAGAHGLLVTAGWSGDWAVAAVRR